ncbi:hypothetical protein GQR58_006189 [Nymphon striatum]|nr:hypothetical protein GQR58_006189 [Nymphon striatum]
MALNTSVNTNTTLVLMGQDAYIKLNKYGYAETTSHLRAINIWSMASDWEAFATQEDSPKQGESLTMSNEYKALNGVITPRKKQNKAHRRYSTGSVNNIMKLGNCIRFQELMEQNRVEIFPKLTELTMGRFIEPRLLARVLRACEKSTAKVL